jgi:hypothetical protein
MPSTGLKDPTAKLPFGRNWAAWCEREGEDILTSTWTLIGGVDDEDVPIPGWLVIEESPAPAIVENTTIVWLSGGTDGEDYFVNNAITTASGKEDDRDMKIVVRNRS